MANPTHTRPPTPVATLSVVQVTEAVEEYLRTKRPDLYAKTASHGIRMTQNGHFVWELHGVRLSGRTQTSLVPA